MVSPPPRRCCVLRRRALRPGASVSGNNFAHDIQHRSFSLQVYYTTTRGNCQAFGGSFLKNFEGFFLLGRRTFFSLNAERVISVLFSLITSTEYIKSVTNYYLFILSLYISLILLYLYIIIFIYYYIHIKFNSNIYSLLVIS